MSAIPLYDHADLSPPERSSLLRLTEHASLDALLRAEPSLRVDDVIAQDEFTHDVLVPLPNGRYLSLESTCLGGLTAVTVWPEHPSADALLQDHLARGWVPLPSGLRTGNRILGYAACLDERKTG